MLRPGLCVLIGATLGLTACHSKTAPSEAETAATARFAISQEPHSFDPLHADDTANQVIQRQVFEGLAEYDRNGVDFSVNPLLATSWSTSDGGKSWVIHLREDAYFYDPTGRLNWSNHKRALTAFDVITSWVRHADSRLRSRSWWAFEGLIPALEQFRAKTDAGGLEALDAWAQLHEQQGLDGLRAVGEHEIHLELQRKEPRFPHRLASPYWVVIPAEDAKEHQLDAPVGTGPYYLTDWEPRLSAVFQLRKDWRGQEKRLAPTGQPALHTLHFDVIREGSTRTTLFERGQVERMAPQQDSFTRFLDQGQLRSKYANDGVIAHSLQTPDLTMLSFNMSDPLVGFVEGDPDGNERRRQLRHTLAAAFPKERWHEVIRNNAWAIPAQTFLPPSFAPTGYAPPVIRFDSAREGEHLKKAQRPKIEGVLSLELAGNDAISLGMGEMIAEAFTRAGYPTVAVPNTWTAFSTKTGKREAQIFLRTWALDWAEPAQMLALFYGPAASPGINRCNYGNPRYDELYNHYLLAQADSERDTIARDMLDILHRDMPASPIDHRRGWLLTRRFERMQPHPFDIFSCKDYLLPK
ncbi:MAG: ABC transporter substrate-binding protein [Planctomycetes bacterium]|jgi:peptide/nickel transport system substrate-binding protein|nr:ABC transporter substrate-binding protein [Planctomycetota bacterium]MBT4028000.1 ABC transporter substrate-binding protein [Planctomycetota bacterium]MBT4561110.1 ABC transporter substrate-binding protein [Planctomycetota bacterium]MBT7318828.1 ABC transporter substrate-binding protein [Planctomycetota bacterium]